MDSFLSIQEAADNLRVDYKTVYRLVRAGKLPAGKFGGMYRIRREDLEAYFQAQVAETAARDRDGRAPQAEDRANMAASQGKCGQCFRLIGLAKEWGGACAALDCGERLCRSCWEAGHRFCNDHQPSADERLAQAQAALARGEIPCLVTALAARQVERAWLIRFDERIRGIGSLYHPGTGEVLRVTEWTPFHQVEDETLQLMRLMNVGFLDKTVQATMPANECSRYQIAAGALGWGRPKQPLTLEARCASHLETYVDQGFDTHPADLDELLLNLTDLEARARETGATSIVGLGSPTGWTAPAIQHITDESGGAYRHPLVLPCLIDLAARTIRFNQVDDRTKQLGFAELFKLPLEAEEAAALRPLIEGAMLMKTGLSTADLARLLEKPEAIVRRACEELAATGRYKVVKEPEMGPVLLYNRD